LTLSKVQSMDNAVCFPCWQRSEVDVPAKELREKWLFVAQPGADATTTDSNFAFAEYLRDMSPGCLISVIDYTNGGGAPILDGYVIAQGELELIDTATASYAGAAPTAGYGGHLQTTHPELALGVACVRAPPPPEVENPLSPLASGDGEVKESPVIVEHATIPDPQSLGVRYPPNMVQAMLAQMRGPPSQAALRVDK